MGIKVGTPTEEGGGGEAAITSSQIRVQIRGKEEEKVEYGEKREAGNRRVIKGRECGCSGIQVKCHHFSTIKRNIASHSPED